MRRLFTALKYLPFIQWPLAFLSYLMIWLVFFTSKIKLKNGEVFEEFRNKQAIFAFWHGRSMMLAPVVRLKRLQGFVIANPKREGRFMAKLLRIFGLKTIWGTTGKTGTQALRHGIKTLRENKMICLAPDGPSGPRMRLHDGILYLAKMTGAPIIYCSFSCNNPWFQSRWDKYLIAKMFGKVIVEASKPIYIKKDITENELQNFRIELENKMIKQMQDLDAYFNLKKIEPQKAK
jgi:lysophospholipid acyltransferase (LPLAT)-like uncharacterized protein